MSHTLRELVSRIKGVRSLISDTFGSYIIDISPKDYSFVVSGISLIKI